MSTRRVTLILLALALCLPAAASAEEVLLRITGAVENPLELTRADLEAMPRIRETTPHRHEENRTVTYEGVTLDELLRRAGAPIANDSGQRSNLAGYVVIRGSDGYRVVYAMAELDPSYAGRALLLADSADGGPLEEAHFPLRVINKGEQRFSRWIRKVDRIEVHKVE